MTDLQIFEEIAGQDIWVRVIEDNDLIYFIKILSISDGNITFNALAPWWCDYVDGLEEYIYREGYIRIDYDLSGITPKFTVPLESYRLTDPVELVTTDEMWDILHTCILDGDIL